MMMSWSMILPSHHDHHQRDASYCRIKNAFLNSFLFSSTASISPTLPPIILVVFSITHHHLNPTPSSSLASYYSQLLYLSLYSTFLMVVYSLPILTYSSSSLSSSTSSTVSSSTENSLLTLQAALILSPHFLIKLIDAMAHSHWKAPNSQRDYYQTLTSRQIATYPPLHYHFTISSLMKARVQLHYPFGDLAKNIGMYLVWYTK